MQTDRDSEGFTVQHWCLFDAATGRIVATETRWIEDGGVVPRGPSENLVREFSSDDHGRHVEIGVLEVERPPREGESVDVDRLVVVAARVARVEGLTSPGRLPGP